MFRRTFSLLSLTAILFMAFPSASYAYSLADYVKKTTYRDGSNFCSRFDSDRNGGKVRMKVYSRLREYQSDLSDIGVNTRALIQMEHIAKARGKMYDAAWITTSFSNNMGFAFCRAEGFITMSRIRRLIQYNIPFDPTLGQNSSNFR